MKRLIVSVLLVLSLALPVIAQEETPTLEFATNTPAPVEVTPEPTPAPDPVAPVSGFNLVEFLAGAALGAVGTLTAVFGIVGRFKNDTPLLNAIEGLTKSIPVEYVDKLNQLGRNIRDAGEVLDKITDKLPNTP